MLTDRVVCAVPVRDDRRTFPSDPPRESATARVTAFLKSGTGLITAATTLIVAVAGLLTAVSKLNHDDANGAASKASPTVVAQPSGPQGALRSHIPAAILPTCDRSDAPEDGSTTALDCGTDGLDGIQYNLFPSADAMARAYAKQRPKLTGDPSAGCAKGSFEGDYVVDGQRRGRLLCFVNHPGEAAIVWTDDKLRVLSFAWRNDEDPEAVYNAWKPGLGPSS
jgi:hypothetical protein